MTDGLSKRDLFRGKQGTVTLRALLWSRINLPLFPTNAGRWNHIFSELEIDRVAAPGLTVNMSGIKRLLVNVTQCPPVLLEIVFSKRHFERRSLEFRREQTRRPKTKLTLFFLSRCSDTDRNLSKPKFFFYSTLSDEELMSFKIAPPRCWKNNGLAHTSHVVELWR